MVWRRRLARSAAVGKGSPPFMLYITTTKRSQYVLTRKMRAGPNFLWRSGDRLSGGLTAETGPSSRAPSSADFSSTYRTEDPAGFLMANLLSESQANVKRTSTGARRLRIVQFWIPGWAASSDRAVDVAEEAAVGDVDRKSTRLN